MGAPGDGRGGRARTSTGPHALSGNAIRDYTKWDYQRLITALRRLPRLFDMMTEEGR